MTSAATGDTSVQAFCRAMWQHDHREVTALAAVVDVKAADKWGNTPLLSAVQYGDRALVELLLTRGASVDQGRTMLTPIALAARRKQADIVAVLTRHGAKKSILTWILLGDRTRVAASLKRDPAGARLLDEHGTPMLLHAAESLQPPMVKLLLAHGAQVTDTGGSGESALHRVADLRQATQPAVAETATLLLDRGAQVDARNWDDVTPLHQAVRARNLAVAEILLARGADANARDRLRGSTPLRRAVSGTGASGTAGTAALMVPLTRLLLAHGADPKARDKRGVPVHASARAPEVRAVLAEFMTKDKRRLRTRATVQKPAKR